MKKIIAVLFALYAFSAYADQKLKTNPDSVTFFPRGALVKHSVKTRVESGNQKIVLSNLPASIDRSSLRISGKGDFTLLNASFRTANRTDEPLPQKIKTYRDSAEYFSDRKVAEEGKLEALKEEMNLMSANRSIGGKDQNITAEQLQSMADFYRNRIAQIVEKRNEAEKEKQKIAEDLKRINDSLSIWDNDRMEQQGEVVLTVHAQTTGSIQLLMSYFTNDAGWNPSYDLRALTDEDKVAVTMHAEVFQKTGVEWEGVHASVSTARPASFTKRPELNPWRLRFIEPVQRPPSVNRPNMPAAMEMSSDSDNGYAAKQRSSETQLDENTLSLDITLGSPLSLHGDGKKEQMVLHEFDAAADFEYFAVPKKHQNAFLVARIPQPHRYKLIPGQMKIFADEVFVGRTMLSNNELSSDTLDISLGIDERIVVNREQTREYAADKKLSSNVKREYKYEISIKNRKSKAVSVTVTDQVPVSTDNDISIEHELPQGVSFNKSTGVFNKKITVTPGEASQFHFGFEVTHPEDKTVTPL